MAKAGVNTKDILSGGLSGALDLAAAGQLEVGRASEIAATAMNQFQLEGKDIPRIADALAAGANKAMGGVDDLAGALEQVGPVANSMGWSLEETTGVLAQFAQAGLVGEKGGTSLRGVLLSLTGPSKLAAEQMEELGIQMYDSQGKTMGAASMAQQLQNALKGLPEAERNAAMARIFGNASIGAATILMEGGAAAAQEWEAAVTDAGFAQAQAATLTDNLRGDLEQLGGALDTVFIQTGSAANGGLRTLVQGLTGAVDVVSRIPGPVLLAGGALTSLALLAPKGVLMWKGYIAQLNSLGWSLDAIALKAPRAAAGLRAMGAAGAVIAGMSIAGAGLEGMWLDVAGANDEATKSLKAYLDGGREADGVTGIMRTGFYDLGASIEHAFGTGGAKSYLLGFLDEVGTGFGMFGPDKLTEATQFFSQMDEGLAGLAQSGNGQAAAELFQRIAGEAQAQGISLDGVKERLPQYATALATAGEAAAKAEPGVAAMAAATNLAGDASADAQGPTDALSELMTKLGQKSEDAADAISTFKRGVDLLAGGERAVRAAQRDFADGIDAVKDAAIKAAEAKVKYGSKSREAAAADRAWQGQIETLAGKMDAETQALMDNGAEVDELRTSYDKNRTAIEKQLTARGLHGEALKREADKIMGTKGKFAELLEEYAKLKPSYGTKIVVDDTGARVAIDGVTTMLNKFNGRIVTAEVRTNYVTLGNAPMLPGTGVVTKRADGGAIYGPGTGTSDSIPAWLSNGEHVLTAREVQAAGGHSAIERMRKALLDGSAPRFANGGAVGYAAGGAVLTGADRSAIEALIRALTNPIRDLANATKAVSTQQAKVNTARAKEASPKRDLNRATSSYAAAVKERDALKTRLIDLKKAADATKGVTNADLRYRAAKEQLARVNLRVTATSKAKTSATEKYKKAAAATKDATDRLRDAQKALAEQQKAVAETAERVSDQFRGQVDGPGSNVGAWIDRLKTGAVDVGEFAKQVEALRKAGLNETLVQQVIGMGARGGSRVATEVLGDKSSIGKLNSASSALQSAADKLGLIAATGVGRYATGGAIYGAGGPTADRVPALLSSGEHVMTAAEVAARGGQSQAYALREMIRAGWKPQGFASGGSPGRAPQWSTPAMMSGSAGIDYDRLAAAVSKHRDGDVTLNAYGLDADEAVGRALRQWERRRTTRV
jgi:TP901 family phage tail tape measure protein